MLLQLYSASAKKSTTDLFSTFYNAQVISKDLKTEGKETKQKA
jgi:hypothetical protein